MSGATRRPEEHAVEGLEHLQAAALELIAAARAFLDVAEDVVREPGVAATIVRNVLGASAPPPTTGRVRRINVS